MSATNPSWCAKRVKNDTFFISCGPGFEHLRQYVFTSLTLDAFSALSSRFCKARSIQLLSVCHCEDTAAHPGGLFSPRCGAILHNSDLMLCAIAIYFMVKPLFRVPFIWGSLFNCLWSWTDELKILPSWLMSLLALCSTNITAGLILTVNFACWSIRAWRGASLV